MNVSKSTGSLLVLFFFGLLLLIQSSAIIWDNQSFAQPEKITAATEPVVSSSAVPLPVVSSPVVEVVMRSRGGGDPGEAACVVKHQKIKIDMRKTAVVVVDMWTGCKCQRMKKSVATLAPKINRFITEARKRGAVIVHCPSRIAAQPKGLQAVANMATIPTMKTAANGYQPHGWNRQLKSEKYLMMIDRTPLGGCSCDRHCDGEFNFRQHKAIQIHRDDYMTASGLKLLGLLTKKKIEHVFYVGESIERCVLGRPFGMRQMIACGFKSHIVRDLADGMHLFPWIKEISPAMSNAMSLEHVERFIAPTILSACLLNHRQQEQFSKNAKDNKPSPQFRFVWEKKTVKGVEAIKLYSKVDTDIYEAVAQFGKVDTGQHKLSFRDLFMIGTGKTAVRLSVKNIQLLVSGVPMPIQWSRNLRGIDFGFRLKEASDCVVVRFTLSSVP